jgi:hypothetical protein
MSIEQIFTMEQSQRTKFQKKKKNSKINYLSLKDEQTDSQS